MTREQLLAASRVACGSSWSAHVFILTFVCVQVDRSSPLSISSCPYWFLVFLLEQSSSRIIRTMSASDSLTALKKELSDRNLEISVLTKKFLEQRKELFKVHTDLEKTKSVGTEQLEADLKFWKDTAERNEANMHQFEKDHSDHVNKLTRELDDMIDANEKKEKK